jgi:hypothetical protein
MVEHVAPSSVSCVGWTFTRMHVLCVRTSGISQEWLCKHACAVFTVVASLQWQL